MRPLFKVCQYHRHGLVPLSSPSRKLWQSIKIKHAGIQRGMGPYPPPPLLKNHKNIGFPNNTSPDPLKYHKATKPAFNVRPSSAGQRNAI